MRKLVLVFCALITLCSASAFGYAGKTASQIDALVTAGYTGVSSQRCVDIGNAVKSCACEKYDELYGIFANNGTTAERAFAASLFTTGTCVPGSSNGGGGGGSGGSGGGSVTGSYLAAGAGAVSRTIQAKLAERLSVKDFGAVGDNVADDTAAIQAAIDASILQGLSHSVFLPAGKYKTSDTIHLGYGVSAYSGITFEGEGAMYSPETGNVVGGGTAIMPTFSDRPAINVQGGRLTVIKGIGIGGKLANYVITNNLGLVTPGGPLVDDTVPGNWNDPALATTQDSRYAPYAGITIDAYSGTRPATSYPNVTYPASLGTVTQYGKLYSSGVQIKDCYIGGFTAGVVVQPCDADGNGDYTTLSGVFMQRVKWGVSVGNTQSRNVHLDHVQINQCYTSLTNDTHGRQQGKFGGTISDLSLGTTINILHFKQYQSTVKFLNFYAEALWRIGTITPNTSQESPLAFESSQFQFSGQNTTRGVPASVLDNGGGSQLSDLPFKSCVFGSFPSVASFFISGAFFDDCSFWPQRTSPQEYERFAHNATAGGLATWNLANPRIGRLKYLPYDHSTGLVAATGNIITGPTQLASTRNTCANFYVDRLMPLSDPTAPPAIMPGVVQIISKSGLTSPTLTNKTLTFSFATRPDGTFQEQGPLPGDVMVDDQNGTTFFVRSRSGLAVTAEMQNNYKSTDNGATFTPVIPLSLTTGNYYVGNSRVYRPQYYLKADVSTTSATLTNVGRDDGFSAWFNADVAVGDSVWARQTSDKWVSQTNSIITARDQTVPSITLTGNPLKAVTGKWLDLFIRAPAANY